MSTMVLELTTHFSAINVSCCMSTIVHTIHSSAKNVHCSIHSSAKQTHFAAIPVTHYENRPDEKQR